MAHRREFKSLELKHSLHSNRFHMSDAETKTSLSNKDDQLAQLRKKRAEILNCIKLIKSGIRKRNRPVQIAMLLTMMGTGVYLIYKYINYINKYNEFKEADLQLQLVLRNQVQSLESTFDQLNSVISQLKNNISDAHFSVKFSNNNDWGHGPISMSCVGSCDTRFTKLYPPFNDGMPHHSSHDFKCTRIIQHQNPLYSLKSWHEGIPAVREHIWRYIPYTPSCGVVDLVNASIRADFQMPHPREETYIRSVALSTISNVIDPCHNLIENFCITSASLLTTNSTLNKMRNRIHDAAFYVSFNDSFYESLGEMTMYYLMSCGLGEFAPTIVIMLTLLTHMFTNCLTSRWFSLSEMDTDEIENIAGKYDIKGDLTSYPKMLKKFQGALPELEQKIEFLESPITFCMASKADPNETPASLVFNDSNLGESKLVREIFDMACLTKHSQLLNASRNQRHVFELGSHLRNALSKHDGRPNSLHSFFSAMRNQTANGDGKNSAEQVMRKIYEFAGFVSVRK